MLDPFLVDPDDRQLFQIRAGTDLTVIGEECVGVLLDAHDLKLCHHKNRLMQQIMLDGQPWLKLMKNIHIRMLIGRFFRFEKWDARCNRFVPVEVPAAVASIVLKHACFFPAYKESEGGAT
jgi:hypothetical protein